MNHSLLGAVFPDSVGSCQHHLFGALLKGICPAPVRSEQNSSEYAMFSPGPFILHPKDLNFLEYFYLFSLLWTSVIPTHVRAAEKINVSPVSPIFTYFHFNFLPNEAFLFHLPDTLSWLTYSLYSLSFSLHPSLASSIFLNPPLSLLCCQQSFYT